MTSSHLGILPTQVSLQNGISGLEGYHSVDFIYVIGPVPVYSSEVVHVRRIVHFDLLAKPSIFRVAIAVVFFIIHLGRNKENVYFNSMHTKD